MSRLRRLAIGAATSALLLGAEPGAPAWAERGYLLATASETTDSRSDDQTMLLDLGSGTSFDFQLASNSVVAIFFTASCAVVSSDDITWVDVDIRVDGIAVPPTDTPEPFCTHQSNVVSVSRDAVVTLSAGPHSVEIAARLFSFDPGELWRVANKSLILVVQETP